MQSVHLAKVAAGITSQCENLIKLGHNFVVDSNSCIFLNESSGYLLRKS